MATTSLDTRRPQEQPGRLAKLLYDEKFLDLLGNYSRRLFDFENLLASLEITQAEVDDVKGGRSILERVLRVAVKKDLSLNRVCQGLHDNGLKELNNKIRRLDLVASQESGISPSLPVVRTPDRSDDVPTRTDDVAAEPPVTPSVGVMSFMRNGMEMRVTDGDVASVGEARRAVSDYALVMAKGEEPNVALRWDPASAWNLSYAVVWSTFPSDEYYVAAKTAARDAASQWNSLCGVRLHHLSEYDTCDSFAQRKTVFAIVYNANPSNVRMRDAGMEHLCHDQYTIAVAFALDFPEEAWEVTLFPGFFEDKRLNQVGVMRHEFGHVLGFMHEDTKSAKRAPSLREMDKMSVMQYPKEHLHGTGEEYQLKLQFKFSEEDAKISKEVYGPPLFASGSDFSLVSHSRGKGGVSPVEAVRDRSREVTVYRADGSTPITLVLSDNGEYYTIRDSPLQVHIPNYTNFDFRDLMYHESLGSPEQVNEIMTNDFHCMSNLVAMEDYFQLEQELCSTYVQLVELKVEVAEEDRRHYIELLKLFRAHYVTKFVLLERAVRERFKVNWPPATTQLTASIHRVQVIKEEEWVQVERLHDGGIMKVTWRSNHSGRLVTLRLNVDDNRWVVEGRTQVSFPNYEGFQFSDVAYDMRMSEMGTFTVQQLRELEMGLVAEHMKEFREVESNIAQSYCDIVAFARSRGMEARVLPIIKTLRYFFGVRVSGLVGAGGSAVEGDDIARKMNLALLSSMPIRDDRMEDGDLSRWQTALELAWCAHSTTGCISAGSSEVAMTTSLNSLDTLHRHLLDGFVAYQKSQYTSDTAFTMPGAGTMMSLFAAGANCVNNISNGIYQLSESASSAIKEIRNQAGTLAIGAFDEIESHASRMREVAEAIRTLWFSGDINFVEPWDPLWADVVRWYVASRLTGETPVKYYRTFRRIMLKEPGLHFEVDGGMVVGIVADWGTGKQAAKNVLQDLWAKLRASSATHKFIVHLGDIYRSGTFSEVHSRFVDIIRQVLGKSMLTANQSDIEELRNVRVLAVPGNHEMYSGGGGFASLRALLGQAATYFRLSNRWVNIVGIDTGITDRRLPAFPPYSRTIPNDGSLTLDQPAFLDQSFEDSDGAVKVVLSHHQPFSAFDEVPNRSSDGRRNVNRMLADAVAGSIPIGESFYWLWGHEHRFTAYKKESYDGRLIGRCVGHGAIPVVDPGHYSHPKFRDAHPYEEASLPPFGESGYFANGHCVLTATSESRKIEYYHVSTRPDGTFSTALATTDDLQ